MSEAKCYLCSMPMLANKNNNVPNDGNAYMHEEHIIHNGIGGRLRSSTILCEKCGGILNDNIDSKFVRIFDLFDSSLKLSKSRNKNSKKNFLIKADILNSDTIEISLDGFEYKPKKPFFIEDKINNEINIYGPDKKTIDNFSKKPNIKEYEKKGFSILKNGNINDLILRFKYKFKYNEEHLFNGITKIALEFALFCGVDANELRHLIDFKNKSILRSRRILKYYPIEEYEKIYEIERVKSDDVYPIHMLKLYGDGTKLYCFVELFSSFQFYVELSPHYKIKLQHSYVQQCLEKNIDLDFSRKIEPDFLSYYKEKYSVDGETLNEILDKIQSEYEKESYEIDENILSSKAFNIYSSYHHQEMISKRNSNILSCPHFNFLNDKAQKAQKELNFHNKINDFEGLLEIYKKITNMEDNMQSYFRIGDNNQTHINIHAIKKEKIDSYFKYKLIELASYSMKDKEIAIEINID